LLRRWAASTGSSVSGAPPNVSPPSVGSNALSGQTGIDSSATRKSLTSAVAEL
jgi:hypothetical protein